MKTKNQKYYEEVIADLNSDAIDEAGYDSSCLTDEKFNAIWRRVYHNLCGYCYSDIIADACEGILPKKDL